MTLDNDYAIPVQSLPTPTDTPYRTPSRGLSWRSSRQESTPSSSPPPFPPSGDSYFHGRHQRKDASNDESISPLDPRRFTPTLHASLVSEILSLRREVESKTGLLSGAEENLDAAKNEIESLNQTVSSHAKETRSFKRQLQLLEGGTLSALSELAKERDEAVESLGEARKRLETSQKKVKSQEDEAERTYASWDRDRQIWEAGKTNMERKIHVVEGRLKTVLVEVAAAHANGHFQPEVDSDADEGAPDTWIGRWSDTTSNRSSSIKGRERLSGTSNSTHDGSSGTANTRLSAMSGINGYVGTKLNGLSLAEELEHDNENEDDAEESDLYGGHHSPDELPEEAQYRPKFVSIQARLKNEKARKVLGLPIENTEHALAKDGLEAAQPIQTEEKSTTTPQQVIANNQQKATVPQSTRPPSSDMQNQGDILAIDEKHVALPSTCAEHAANQSRKRVSINPTPLEQTNAIKPVLPEVLKLVSVSCQTIAEPLGFCLAPMVTEISPTPAPVSVLEPVEMKPASTQTNNESEPQLSSASSRDEDASSVSIPVIAIHPPGSAPNSPFRNSVMLPPQTRNVACQAAIHILPSVRSISVQTERIRIDKRNLPPRLLPSTISSKPPSPSRTEASKEVQRDRTSPRKNSRRNLTRPFPAQLPPSRPKATIRDGDKALPKNNDIGPLGKDPFAVLKRPVRSDGLFTSINVASDEGVTGIGETDFSDDEFRNAAPIRKTLSKAQGSWKLVPHSTDSVLGRLESTQESSVEEPEVAVEETRSSKESTSGQMRNAPKVAHPKKIEKPTKLNSFTKQPNIRRTALISSGTAAHQKRPSLPKTSSETSAGTTSVPPPFPVPTRSSSRKIPLSSSEGARSPTLQSTSFFPESRSRENERPPIKKNVLRKIRSATAVSRTGLDEASRSRSRSPPPPMPPSAALESPQLPLLPRSGITMQHASYIQQITDRPQPSFASHTNNNSISSAIQPISVVDAIAQTMVGEWMWKYVRKRKSFGIAETPQAEFDSGRSNGENGSNGVRHKRWVWLAPYERAVMWSSKQPTSGSALLGKNGRKLAIQSVLDVKDDAAMPKNFGPNSQFNRSILVLTPQRALKFTATSKERHHVWLTALSFLSHSTLGMEDLATIPPIPQQEYQRPPRPQLTATSLRRHPIRDSIRVAKSKSRPSTNGAHSYTSSVPGIQQQAIQEVDSPYRESDVVSDAAEPPHVPRFSTHTRNRSNTGPRPAPPNSFRSFPANHPLPSSHGSYPIIPRDHQHTTTSFGNTIPIPRRASETTVAQQPSNFFDAVGTIRMEAFIGRREGGGHLHAEGGEMRPPRNSYRTRQGRKKDLSYWGVEGGEGSVNGVVDDPFGGF